MPDVRPEPVVRQRYARASPWTFSIPPVRELLGRWLAAAGVVLDPFAGHSLIATHRNDQHPDRRQPFQQDARDWLRGLPAGLLADAVLFDPPYSPRQLSEHYRSIGQRPSTRDTQNARLYREVKDLLHARLKVGGLAVSCGWNSCGFGTSRGYQKVEILLVQHGSAHNDTIVTVERRTA